MITINSIVVINNGLVSIGSGPKGSIYFSGNTSSYLTINNDIDLRFRTGDFTVEWFQYQTDNNSFPRPWSLGSWLSTNLGVSLESGLFYLWINGVLYNQGSIGMYKNVWTHFAVVRIGSIIRVFKNGNQIGSDISSSYDFNDSVNLLGIGGEPNHTYGTATFGGYITNFRWVKGTPIYTTTFQVPSTPLTVTPDTKILLLSKTNSTTYIDSSGLNKTINYLGTSWDSKTPF